jgi:hypothetical protein
VAGRRADSASGGRRGARRARGRKRQRPWKT